MAKQDILRPNAIEPDERDFDFAMLWLDEEQGSMATILSIVAIVLNVIVLILLFTKK